MPAIPPAPLSRPAPSDPGPAEILRSGPSRAAATLAVAPQHLQADGCVGVAALFGLAAEAIQAGIACRHGAESVFCPTDAKTVVLLPRAANRLDAVAEALPAPEGAETWQVTITAQDAPLAVIVQTGHVRRPAPADAAPGPPVPANAAQPEVQPERRARIIAAATEVIARKGFGNATIREIAEEAGVHVPILYQHVSGKDELLEQVYAHEMDSLARELDIALAEGATAPEKIARMISVALDVGDRRRRQIGILNRELKSLRPDARARTLAEYRSLIGRYETVLDQGIAAGEFKEIDRLVAANYIDMVSDIWSLRQFFLAGHDLEAYRRTAIDFVLSGLRRDRG